MRDTITHTFPLRLPDGSTIQTTLERRPRDATRWIQLAAGGIQETSTSNNAVYHDPGSDREEHFSKERKLGVLKAGYSKGSGPFHPLSWNEKFRYRAPSLNSCPRRTRRHSTVPAAAHHGFRFGRFDRNG
jgi:hypothetical protein